MRRGCVPVAISLALILSLLVACGGSVEDLTAVEYAPVAGQDWQVATPAEQGLDPLLVAELYLNAAELETLYGLLVVKGDHLVAEKYFNGADANQVSSRQSVTKSYTSALVGIALDQGCFSSLDQKMTEFFPEFAGQIDDPRKQQITIRDMLQMRAGYPWEEKEPPYNDVLFFSDNWFWLPHLVDFPLTSDPGTDFGYSNLTSHLLGVAAARACDTDLKTLAEEHLFSPMAAHLPRWITDPDDHNWGFGEIYVTARDMAKFGLLYLDDGKYQENQIIPAAWVSDSLERYTEGMGVSGSGRYGEFRELGYGYQWWSASAGDHQFNYASGHGGQLIVLLDELDMIVATTADPMAFIVGDESWRHERAIVDLVSEFIKALPEA